LKKGGWYAHETRDAAIKILNAGIRPSSFGCGPGYAWVDLECCRVVSGYASPNATLGEFHAFLDRIRGIISGSRKQVLLAGDFNAKSAAWGSRSEDHRGEALADLLAESDMVVQNRGCDPTFSGPHGNSTIDITVTSVGLARRLNAWRVDKREMLSDHLLIWLAKTLYSN
jgi:hypothetical protein